VEIRINSHLTRKISWQHDTHEPHRHHEWPPFVITIKESGWVLPHPSTVFHAKTSTGSPWVAQTLSQCTSVKRGKVSFYSTTVEATKFVGPHKSRMRQYIINASCGRAQSTWSLIDTGGGYHLWSSEYENRRLSTFPSGILHFPLVAPPNLTYSYKSDH
jgi:hypothetical protein